ncbi:MAG TPA: glycosyltransferase family 2 protein [bacterium]|nr:glycosyltransferase family 2 protein [bacterium]
MKIFCIIPAWNESLNIVTTIQKVLNYVDFLVIINDCSTDNTLKKAQELQNQYPDKIKVLSHPINLGQGASLQTGNDYALLNGAEIIVHFDGDGQFLAEEIIDIINPIIKDNYDIVFGSRFLEKKSSIPKFKKNIIMPLAKIFNFIFFGIKTSDPQIGFRAMTASTAQKIRIENNRMAHATEILAKAYKYKLKIKEVPVTVIYNRYGQKFSGGFKIIKDLFFKKIIS